MTAGKWILIGIAVVAYIGLMLLQRHFDRKTKVIHQELRTRTDRAESVLKSIGFIFTDFDHYEAWQDETDPTVFHIQWSRERFDPVGKGFYPDMVLETRIQHREVS